MDARGLSRRRFALSAGAGLASSLIVRREAFAANAAPAPAAGPILINSNENPYGPSPAAWAAVERARAAACRYPDDTEDEARAAIARHHGLAPENVQLGCGSGEVLRMAAMAYTAPDKAIVAAEPTFEAVLVYARVPHARAVRVPLTSDFRHDLPRMARACDAGVGLLYVCNPNNPTGTIVSRDELKALFAAVPPTTTILVDEAYHHFVEDPSYGTAVDFLASVPNLVVTRTFSKVYGMAGLRLGYAVASPANVRALRAQAIFSDANAAALAAAAACLDDAQHVAEQRRLLNGTRERVCAQLSREGRRVIPSQANFFMVDVGGEVRPVIEAFRKRGVLVGRPFPPLNDWLRVSIGTPSEMDSFLRAMNELVPVRRAS